MRPGIGKKFSADQSGAVLVEGIIALPVLVILTFGILEFGNMMWQRQQLQIGVRDAARYWSRCRPTNNGSAFMQCSIDRARNIAFYGNPAGTGGLRVPGWDNSAEITIEPATPPTVPSASDLVTVTGRVTYQGSPVFNAVMGNSVTLGYYNIMRYQGW